MKTVCVITLMLLAVGFSSAAVQVEEGDFKFPLEAVRKLQEMADSSSMAMKANPRIFMTGFWSICSDPNLPKEFQPLCLQKGGVASLSRLAMVPMDVCEICAFAACTGCF